MKQLPLSKTGGASEHEIKGKIIVEVLQLDSCLSGGGGMISARVVAIIAGFTLSPVT